MQSDRLSHLNLENYKYRKSRPKLKYENCVALSFLYKNSNCCLKKILHVPTMTMHYMR